MKAEEFRQYCLDQGGVENYFGVCFKTPVKMQVKLGNFNIIDEIVGMNPCNRLISVNKLHYDVSECNISKTK